MENALKRINPAIFFTITIVLFLYIASSFLTTFTFAIFLSSLMLPVASKIEQWTRSRILSSFICMLIISIFISGFLIWFILQLSDVIQKFSELKPKLNTTLDSIQDYIAANLHIAPKEQIIFLKNQINGIGSFIETILKNLTSGTISFSLQLLLILVYIFLLLLKRDKYKEFILMFIKEEPKKRRAIDLINKITNVAHRYLWGRIKVMIILGIMYMITFLIFGIENAILLSLVGAVIVIIPYLGSFISGLIPVIIYIFMDKDFFSVLFLGIIVNLIQLSESYIFTPLIVGNQMRLSPLAIIIAIMAGGAIWGLMGMILFVPMLAILKIIFDHTEELKPFGFLIGDSRSATKGISEKIKSVLKIK